MDINRYSHQVLMGNWKEESFITEEKKRKFKMKKEMGNLKIQKTKQTFANMFKEVALSLPEDCVRYGSIVQLLAPDLSCVPTGDSGKRGLTLSCLPSEADVDSAQHLAEGCLLTASPHVESCVRNSFIISSADGRERNGDPLKYGESFTLRPAVTKNGEWLYVHSKVGPLNSELGQSGEPTLQLSTEKNTYTRWHCLYVEPGLRPETTGSVVIPNERLVINHSATNRRLSVEHDFWFKSLFGMECEVALHTYLDVHKKEMAKNIWMIVTQRHGVNKVAVRCLQ